MKVIKAKKDFSLNGKFYIVGDEIKDLDIKDVAKLNEKGFIEPLSYRDLVLLERDNKLKKEEKENGINTR